MCAICSVDCIRVESHIGELVKTHDQQLTHKANEHQRETDRNKALHESVIAQVRREHDMNVDLQKAAGVRELDQLKTVHSRRLEECDKTLESHKKIHAEVCTKKDLDLARAVAEHEQSLEALSQHHVSALKMQKEAHERELLSQKKAHERELLLRMEAHDETTAERDRALREIAQVEAPLREALNQTSNSLKEVRCEMYSMSVWTGDA